MNTIKISFDSYRDKLTSKDLHFYSFSNFIFIDFRFVIDDLSQEHPGVDLEYIVNFEPMNKILIITEKDYCGCNPNEYYFVKAQWIYQDDILKGSAVMHPECRSTLYGEASDIVAKDTCKIVLWYMGFIMSEINNRAIKIKDKKLNVPHKYSREHRLSTEKNKIYLLDDLVKYASDNYVAEGIHHEISCPCWEVRGHYRHYKSGKVVFIPAYHKGKERDKVQPKEKEYYL